MQGIPISKCKRLGFYMIELAAGLIQLPVPDQIHSVKNVKKLR